MKNNEIINEINRLRKAKNAVILAHNYQCSEVQDIADFVGDSLELSKKATNTDADLIVFCGVHFMAESAKLLSPHKKVLLPVKDAGCPMADMVDGDSLRAFKEKHRDAKVVCYVNSSAEVKAESDICCTSSNAIKVVEGLDCNKVIFAPDRNLGSYVAKHLPEKEIIVWDGFCITHQRVTAEEVVKVKDAKPGVKVLVHPECNPKVVELGDFIGSTSEIINYVNNSQDLEFIIGTEMGILHKLKNSNPEKKFYILSPKLVCANMKKTKLHDVLKSLRDENNEINVNEDIMTRAKLSLEKMMEI